MEALGDCLVAPTQVIDVIRQITKRNRSLIHRQSGTIAIETIQPLLFLSWGQFRDEDLTDTCSTKGAVKGSNLLERPYLNKQMGDLYYHTSRVRCPNKGLWEELAEHLKLRPLKLYNKESVARVSNEFSTAAYRSGHSTLQMFVSHVYDCMNLSHSFYSNYSTIVKQDLMERRGAVLIAHSWSKLQPVCFVMFGKQNAVECGNALESWIRPSPFKRKRGQLRSLSPTGHQGHRSALQNCKTLYRVRLLDLWTIILLSINICAWNGDGFWYETTLTKIGFTSGEFQIRNKSLLRVLYEKGDAMGAIHGDSR
ncbi:Uncharacterized protein APZ42_024278 [Daphnia magna]|uniref:Uncharacterized protein n=1 Tax=Daphnia magna TaxID=35525 RepID=A0A164ULC1_9CRUS|nr:Uncharacterized protein APZ42_024278 [Daphnia magna]